MNKLKMLGLLATVGAVAANAAITVPDVAPLTAAVESGVSQYLGLAFTLAAVIIPALWVIGALSMAFRRR